jgi:hypothetical protein
MMRDANLRKIFRFVNAFPLSMCAFLLSPSTSLASAEVCRQPIEYSHLSAAYYKHDESALTGSTGHINRENYDFDLQLNLNESWVFGVGHRYVTLDVDPIELQTNGHLHTLFFPVHKQSESGNKSFRFSFAPALSASSNVMKDLGGYSSDSIQFLAALVWKRKLSERVTLRYGACGDSRFGTYAIFPSIGIDWRPHADLIVELGFPTTRLTYQALPNVNLLLRIAPDGNEWHVKNKDLEKQSQLISEAILLEWAIIWRARKQLTITGSIGRRFINRYDVTLLDDSRVRLSGNSVTRIGAALEWRF